MRTSVPARIGIQVHTPARSTHTLAHTLVPKQPHKKHTNKDMPCMKMLDRVFVFHLHTYTHTHTTNKYIYTHICTYSLTNMHAYTQT